MGGHGTRGWWEKEGSKWFVERMCEESFGTNWSQMIGCRRWGKMLD